MRAITRGTKTGSPRTLARSVAKAWAALDEEDSLAALEALATLQIQLDALMFALTDQARAEGHAWRKIGAALGVSTQAAWERFALHD